MAIKVKHEGNVTSRVVASNIGSAAKNMQENALKMKQASAQENIAANRQLDGARAIGASAPTPSAHLGSASPGAGVGSSPLPRDATSRFKTTGDDPMSKPDAESSWDGSKWVRQYRPGELESESYDAMTGSVAKRYTAQQQAEWEQLNDVVNEAERSGRYTPDEMKAIREQVDVQRMRIKDNPRQLLQREETAQQAFDRNTFTDQNGMVYTRDGRLVYNPNESKQRLLSSLIGTFAKPYVKESQAVGANGEKLFDPDTGAPVMVKETVVPDEQEALERAYRALGWEAQTQTASPVQTPAPVVSQAAPSDGLSSLERQVLGLEQTPGITPQQLSSAKSALMSSSAGKAPDLSQFAKFKVVGTNGGDVSAFGSETSSATSESAPKYRKETPEEKDASRAERAKEREAEYAEKTRMASPVSGDPRKGKRGDAFAANHEAIRAKAEAEAKEQAELERRRNEFFAMKKDRVQMKRHN